MPDPFLTRRGGLPHFGRKIASGRATIGYLGGSVTAMKDGWRSGLTHWFNQQFPAGAPHREINAGRGGIGSASGAFFVHEDILGCDPDLVFVEYIINDSYEFQTPAGIRELAVEGIVRAIRYRHPNCDICFVYMTCIGRQAEIDEAIKSWEKIASHYSLPSIHVGAYLHALVDANEWSFGAGDSNKPPLLRDVCHPTVPGNQLITAFIARCITNCINPCDASRQSSQSGIEALSPANICNGIVMPVDPTWIVGPYTRHRQLVSGTESEVEFLRLPLGTQIRYPGNRTLMGLYVVVGPQSGIVTCTYPGDKNQPPVRRDLFDQWCYFKRISTCIFAENPADLNRPNSLPCVELNASLPDYAICPKLQFQPEFRLLDVVSLLLV